MYLSPNMDLNGLFILIFAIMLAPPLLLTIIGFVIRKNNKKGAKILFILAAVYLIVALGICGSVLS